LRRFLKSHNPQAKIIECNHEPRYLQDVNDRALRLDLASLSGRRVAAISAIAVPTSFEQYLESLEATVVYRKRYVDHHRYHPDELADFCRRGRQAGAEFLLTTEKDAVRLPILPAGHLPFFFLRVEIVILKGQEYLDHCISQICLGW
ncbi:MAG: tetraacyldisaccharide 4'-kinase, partial [Oligosphaeraceae bacterium]|nr:tetraacyldisaccharide 4'-kinase [Oligosphaeraceae bacterium]